MPDERLKRYKTGEGEAGSEHIYIRASRVGLGQFRSRTVELRAYAQDNVAIEDGSRGAAIDSMS